MKNNQIVAASTALVNSINWDLLDLVLQAIIQGVNQGKVGPWLTEGLRTQAWNIGRFIVRDHFKVDVSKNAKVKISYLGDNFKAWLIHGTEDLAGTHELISFPLTESSFDKDIIDKIGGVDKSVSSLQDILAKMKAQPKGPEEGEGKLGQWNIIYVPQPVIKLSDNSFSYVNEGGETITEEVKDSQYLFEINDQWFVLRAVRVRWRDDSWGVGAGSVGSPDRWLGGCQVFSRKVLESSETLVKAQA